MVRRMKIIPSLMLTALLLSFQFSVSAAVPALDEISAEAAVLMDAETGQVLYGKNAERQRHPASLTKILTAILALENLEPEQMLTASEQAVDLPGYSSSAGIEAGERLTVDQIMYALMLRSANEAANILAEEVAGSQEDFVVMMNERALEIGATSTSFSNAHGLPSRRMRHFTTAHDIALITREALGVEGFKDYFGAASYSMDATNLSEARKISHTHRMLLRDYAEYDEQVIGGKTGYTGPSGYTLATVAERDGRTLICVVLRSESMYADTRRLLDFGFLEFSPYTYTFADSYDLIEVSVFDGDWEAGRASFTFPATVDLLLHESIEPGTLDEEAVYPKSPKKGDEITGRMELRAEGNIGGLPTILMAIPMNVELTEFDPPAVEAVAVPIEIKEEQEPEKTDNRKEIPMWMILLPIICVIIVAIAARATKRQSSARH